MNQLDHALRGGNIVQLTGASSEDRQSVVDGRIDGTILTADCTNAESTAEIAADLVASWHWSDKHIDASKRSELERWWLVEDATEDPKNPTLFIKNIHELDGETRTSLARRLKAFYEATDAQASSTDDAGNGGSARGTADATIVVGTRELELLERAEPDLTGRCYTHDCTDVMKNG
jgi:hypothetical protein